MLFPQGCFGYSEPLAFLCEFRISLSISVKSAMWDFDRDQIDSVNHHGECCLLNMKTCNPPTWDVFHLFRSLFMFLSIFFIVSSVFLFILLNLLSILFLFDAIVNEIVFLILLLGCHYYIDLIFYIRLHPAVLMNSFYSSIIFSP